MWAAVFEGVVEELEVACVAISDEFAYERPEVHVVDEVVGVLADPFEIASFIFSAGDQSCAGGSGDAEAEVALGF